MCKIIKRLLDRAIKTTDRQQMVPCLVYIGAVKDNEIHVVEPAWWQLESFSFAFTANVKRQTAGFCLS